MLVGSRLLAQGHLRRRPPTSTSALAILDRPIPWSRLGLLAALPVTATAIYALAGVTLASPDRLRARQQTLIWSQTAIGWAGFLTALLAARRTGRGRVG